MKGLGRCRFGYYTHGQFEQWIKDQVKSTRPDRTEEERTVNRDKAILDWIDAHFELSKITIEPTPFLRAGRKVIDSTRAEMVVFYDIRSETVKPTSLLGGLSTNGTLSRSDKGVCSPNG